MANEIFKAQTGLAGLLDNITGLKVYPVRPDTINDRSGVVAIVEYAGGEQMALGGSSFMGRMTIELIAMPRLNNSDATRALLELLAPIGAKSIEAAIERDTTWNGTVDDGRVDVLEPTIGIESEEYAFHKERPLMRAIVNTKFYKTVTT